MVKAFDSGAGVPGSNSHSRMGWNLRSQTLVQWMMYVNEEQHCQAHIDCMKPGGLTETASYEGGVHWMGSNNRCKTPDL